MRRRRGRRRPERFDGHAAGVVADPAADAVRRRQAEDPRAESDALHDAADLDSTPVDRLDSGLGATSAVYIRDARPESSPETSVEHTGLALAGMMSAMGRRIAGIAIVAAAAGAALLPIPASWVEARYSRGWYPAVQRTLTPLSNAVPFALIDALILAGAGMVVLALVSVPRAPHGGRLAMLGRRAWHCAVAAAVTYLAFLVTWGANYRREPLTALLDFDQGRVTAPAVVALE